MRNIKTALKISGSLILLSFILSISIIYYLKLDNPVFLKNYIDVNYYEYENMYTLSGFDIELKYIANIEDKRKVVSVIFEEAPELNFYASENGKKGAIQLYENTNDNIESYGRYGIHTVFLNFNLPKEGYKLDETIKLSKAKVKFDDELVLDVDLGKIILSKINKEASPLERPSLTGSSDGYSQLFFWVKDYIQVSKIYSQLFEDTRDLFDFNINKVGDIEERDLIYNKGDNLFFTSQFNNIDDPIKKLYTYDIKPIMYFKDRMGKEYEERIYNITYNPYFTFYNIYRYLVEMEEI
ncbi:MULTISPECIES: hypothetical protein [unclassified Clostridium]|uniref:hypothetical protein n=1 Tax=unclassified Clostridium TaxID=2614128 RepID=UPI0025C3C355|nr:hypothetical protein [Clostridium sp.]MDY2631289.1 hypothetical protein [Clostridium sp.]MDY4251012.1 hypothetical protein [Clostridium sp.]